MVVVIQQTTDQGLYIYNFLETILKGLYEAPDSCWDNLLKTYFAAGVRPEYAKNRKDADALKGGAVYCF